MIKILVLNKNAKSCIEGKMLKIQGLTPYRSYTLNNRTLWVFRKAGIEPTKILDVTGDFVKGEKLTERLAEMGGSVSPDFVPPIRKKK